MSGFKYNIKDTVRDIVTDYYGMITARVEYFNGNKQYLVEARGERPNEFWFTEERLLILKSAKEE